MAGILVLALAAWLPTGPAHPPGQLSALLSLPRRLHALTLIDKNLILPPWPYKAWFPSPESLAGPLTFLISCSCLLLWCCFGRGQGGHGEWKHLAGQTISAPCLLSLQTLAPACPCYLWPFAQGGLAVGARLGRLSFSAGRVLSCPCTPWHCSSELCPTSLPLPLQAGAQIHRCLEIEGREVCGVRLGCRAEFGALLQLPRPVCSSAGCWELEQPCCASVMGTRLAAKVFFRWPCGRSSPAVPAQATRLLLCSNL